MNKLFIFFGLIPAIVCVESWWPKHCKRNYSHNFLKPPIGTTTATVLWPKSTELSDPIINRLSRIRRINQKNMRIGCLKCTKNWVFNAEFNSVKQHG